jgi:hypothetical protein
MIDIILLAIIAVVTWCVASEGGWGASLIFFQTLLAGILTMNYFEPLAGALSSTILPQGHWQYRSDFIAFCLLFAGLVTLFRVIGEYIMPTFMHTEGYVHDGARWGMAALTGYVTMAILLTALHTAALPRDFLGFTAERKNFFGVTAPDRQWLGYMQYLTENAYKHDSNIKIFDGPQFAILPGQEPKIWSSFPIRYADRRGVIDGGNSGGAAADDFQVVPATRTSNPNAPSF